MIAAAVLFAAALTAGAPKIVVEELADGTELVFVRMPGAKMSSLRYVVRSGSAVDPPSMAGLAHLLEHLVFHGSYGVKGRELWDSTRLTGATLNAFTTPGYTYYALDAPAAEFGALASKYISVITNPALMIADLENERGVVSNESALRSSVGLLWFADQLMFSGLERGATPIGTRRSRDSIQRRDLAAYFTANYVPSNITAIVAGDMELDQARKWVEDNTHLPPNLPEEKLGEQRGDLNLPMREKSFAPYDLTVIGYQLAGVERATCRELAALVELRVMMAAQVERPLASDVETYCARLRGHDFLFLFSASKSYEGGALPDVLRTIFTQATQRGPSAKEKEILRARGRHAVAALWADPAQLTEALVPEVAIAPRPGAKRRFDAVLAPPKLDSGALLRAAKSSFREQRRVEIRLSPFGG